MSFSLTGGKFQAFTSAGALASGYLLYTYASGTTTNQATYTSATLGTANANPVVLDARGEASVWLGSSAYTFVLKTAAGVTVWTVDGVRDPSAQAGDTVDALKADLAATDGASLLGYQSDAAGAIETDLYAWAKAQPLNAVVDFGCDNTGATNCTTEMLAFYNACINGERPGYIPAGDYLITAGQLAFDNAFADKNWPDIFTDGHEAVKFKRADSTNSPMLTLTNGTASSGVGQYWRGGSHGGITIDQNGKSTSSGQHGIAMRGVWGTRFGHIRMNDGGGSAVYMLPALYGLTNPDPYAVTFCAFEAVEANRCKLYAVQNDNYVGMNGCYFDIVRAIECESGVFYGFGASNRIGMISAGSCKGYALDDGTHNAATGGAPSGLTIMGRAELDDCQYGVRLNRTTIFRATDGIRFVHRYNFSALNPSGGYWPRKAFIMAAGTSPNVADVQATLWHRIEAGGSKSDMGAFVDGSSNGNITNAVIDQRLNDNAGFGFVDTDLYTGLSSAASLRILRDGYAIDDRIPRTYVRANAAAGLTIANTGYTTAKVSFTTEVSDRLGLWSTNTFTCSRAGDYRVTAKLCLTMTAGKQCRIAAMVNSSAAADFIGFATGSAATHYVLHDVVTLAAGDTLWISADQDTATASLAVSAPINIGVDNHLIIEALS